MWFLNSGLDGKSERRVIAWILFFVTMPIWGVVLLIILATIFGG